ncbi:PspA/IM30 family protein [Lysinibacillus sp. OL1_EC]|jgi:lia operon protein LiaH|uniref:PspA/IM30 family protein n=1 Tax=unclassified Lysinibacillus TaxID=2636778 RepID=UPI001038A966|nr:MULTISPECIES: PspA/IM30 family protein [unclassified Lysinibacillus]MCM0623701.1 PspA/IM30 family protein [Lysinibacillus sp. OL1_EC]TBV89402.1 PspA/IM30 family protein [Lysinibacillus sp. OL1]UKJ46543.1 PspA/IM30 family protein [Lysinibacillus sp. ACHW1.5]WGT38640.1 PspA/IM30 family protein [Lysinibacillus sp. 1 U-2021]
MNLFQRFRYTIEADLHQLFDKKEQKNPIAMLNQYIREAEKQTEQTGKLLERQGQLKEKLEQEYKENADLLAKRESQLALAKSSGEQDLIDFATDEVTAYSARNLTLQASIEASTREYFELERKFETMKHKIKDMKVRQLQLMGKENVTRAHHQMDGMIAKNNKTNFEDLEAYIDKLAYQIDKDHELTTFEARLAELEKKAVEESSPLLIENK